MPVEILGKGEYGTGRWLVGYVYTGAGDVTHIRTINTTGARIAFRLVETDAEDRPTAKDWRRTAVSLPTDTPVDVPVVDTTRRSLQRIKRGGEIPGDVVARPRRGFAIECQVPG